MDLWEYDNPLAHATPMGLVSVLAWVTQGRCGICHVKAGKDDACPRCGSSWRAGCGDDDVPWVEERAWMRCRTWFIHGAPVGLADEFLGRNHATVLWQGAAHD